MLRGFPPTNEPYLNKFHVKPSAPLIRMLIDRTKGYSHKEHLAKTEPSNRMSVALSTNGIFVPGYAMVDRSYWLLPIAVPNRELFKAFCEKQGVFCVYKTTQIASIDMPKDKLEQGLKPAINCEKFMNNVVYLPVNMTVPKKELDLMIKRFLGIAYRYQLFAEYMSK